MSDSTTGALVWGAETTSEENTFALVSHLAIFFFPILLPLAVYFIKKNDSKFVAYHALQATIWQALAFFIGGTLCLGIGTLLGYVAAVMWALKSHKGEWAGYPLIEGVGREA